MNNLKREKLTPNTVASSRSTSTWQGAAFAIVFVAILLVAGCATEVAHHTFLKQAYAPKPANYAIDIYTNTVPTRPFERVALLDVHCESQGFMTPNLEQDAIPALIKEARSAGCDAVIEIQERPSAGNWTLETRVKHFTAVGIAYIAQ